MNKAFEYRRLATLPGKFCGTLFCINAIFVSSSRWGARSFAKPSLVSLDEPGRRDSLFRLMEFSRWEWYNCQ
jgi:hypothetical protein